MVWNVNFITGTLDADLPITGVTETTFGLIELRQSIRAFFSEQQVAK